MITTCPCCSDSMLRHIRHQQVYWFCRSCWQEMPFLESKSLSLVPTALNLNFTPLSLKQVPVAA